MTGPVKAAPPESVANASPVKHHPCILTCGSWKCRWLASPIPRRASPLKQRQCDGKFYPHHHRHYLSVHRHGTHGTPPPYFSPAFHLRLNISLASYMYVNTIASSTSANGNAFVIISLLSYVVPDVPSDPSLAYSCISLSSSV